MEQLNRVELRGLVGSVRLSIISGRKVANFTVATNYAYKSKDGTPQIDTEWHNVVAWENERFPELDQIHKGMRIYVVGRIHSQKFVGQDNVERLYQDIQATRLVFLDESDSFACEMA